MWCGCKILAVKRLDWINVRIPQLDRTLLSTTNETALVSANCIHRLVVCFECSANDVVLPHIKVSADSSSDNLTPQRCNRHHWLFLAFSTKQTLCAVQVATVQRPKVDVIDASRNELVIAAGNKRNAKCLVSGSLVRCLNYGIRPSPVGTIPDTMGVVDVVSDRYHAMSIL